MTDFSDETFDLAPTLKGETLELHPLAPADFEALYAVAADPLVWEQHPERERFRRDVFEKFFRRQGVSADGVGLGLAICREITHAHRGAIWIEDGHLGGASVCVALPVGDA